MAFSAPGFVVHQTKDQFTLTTGICRTHKTGNIISGHELFQDSELLLCSDRNLIPPVSREDRQVSIRPLAVFFIVGFGLCQLHQMTDTPTDDVAVSYKVAIFTFVCTQHLAMLCATEGFSANTNFIRICSFRGKIKAALNQSPGLLCNTMLISPNII